MIQAKVDRVKAAIGGDVSSNVSLALNGAYAEVDHNGNLAGEDYSTWIVAGTVHWRATSGLTISGEIAYEEVNPDVTANFVIDDSIWGAMLRINRVF